MTGTSKLEIQIPSLGSPAKAVSKAVSKRNRHLRTKIPTPYHEDTQSNIIETPWKYKHTSIVTMGSSSNYHYTAATRPVP